MKSLFKTLLLSCLMVFSAATTAGQYDNREIECLTKNAYFESRGEPEKGQIAVIYTTLNRAKSGKFPNDLCSVVYQRKQFSWTSNRNRSIKEKDTYAEIKQTVKEVLNGEHRDPTQGGTYFHANSIRKPSWAKGMSCTAKIGGHSFYKSHK